MIFYASGVFTTPSIQQTVVDYLIAILTSFAEASGLKRSLTMLAARCRAANICLPVMIDSGAFSAWNSGKRIDMGALIRCCNDAQNSYSDCFDFAFVALDVIPGSRGAAPTTEEAEQAAVESRKNYDIMRAKVSGYVMPVFHATDPKWWAQYCRANAPFVGVSVSQDWGSRHRYIANMAEYFRATRLHGLAMTGTETLRAAPWHSVDSATFGRWAGFGAIAWVRADGSLQDIPVTARRLRGHQTHLDTIAPFKRDVILREVARLGFTEREIQESIDARAAFNLIQFKRACAVNSTALSEVA